MRTLLLLSILLNITLCSFAQVPHFAWINRALCTSNDSGSDIAVDANGNSFVTGTFENSATFGSTTLTSSGEDDIFIVKYDASGNVIWAKSAGGQSDDSGNSVAIDGSGNSYVTGSFTGTATFGSITLTGAYVDVFVAKYDASGNVLWVRKAGWTGTGGIEDRGTGIAVDGNGNCYVTGTFETMATFGNINLTSNGNDDIFIAKYDSAGNVLWARSAGGISTDLSFDIAVDSSGNSYVTGGFRGTMILGSDTLTTSIGFHDIFIVKHDETGNAIWVKSAGGIYTDQGSSIAIDGSGNCYVTGIFEGTAIFGTTTLVSSGDWDIFIAKFDNAGNILWAKSAGTGAFNADYSNGIAVDSSGNSYVTGMFTISITFGSTTLTGSGSGEIFITKYDAAGNVLWAKSAGGTNVESGNGIAVDGSGNCYVTGNFWGIVNFDSTTISSNGLSDFFITRLGNFIVNIEELSAAGFTAWPNPFVNSFEVKLPSSTGAAATVTLSDLLGRQVHRQQLTATGPVQTVNPPAALPSGVYVLQVVQGTEVRQLRIVRE